MAESFYVSLLNPAGLENLPQEAGTQFIDTPHVTLFPIVYPSQNEYEVPVQQALGDSIRFLRQAIRSNKIVATLQQHTQFNNLNFGYVLDFSAEAKEILQRVADFLNRKGMIPTAAVGDPTDQQTGTLHMTLFQDVRNKGERAYQRLVDALKKYVGQTVTFGDVRYEPKRAAMQIKLSAVGVEQYREHIRSWSDDDLTQNFLYGLTETGVDELGRPTTAGDLMYDEWMLRRGHYNDVGALNRVLRCEGRDAGVEYNENMQRIAASRAVEDVDDGALFR